VGDAVTAARGQPDDVPIRVGLAGVPATSWSVTEKMFAPCSNIVFATREIAQLAERCRASARSKDDPIHCAVAAYHGSWERPDNRFADAVRTSAADNDAPDFEMPAGAGTETTDGGSSRQTVSRDATPATPPSPPPDDDERARQSPLFPVMTRASDRSPSDHPVNGQPATGEQKINAHVHPTATQLHPDGLFVQQSGQRSASGSE
jgi:hypothetical protein